MRYIDIVQPRNNETSLINKARELGYSGVCFIYDESNTPKTLLELKDFKIATAVLTQNPQKHKKKIIFSDSNDVNLIKQKPKILFNIEEEKDSMHQRRSGLNQVICKLMKEKGVSYGISINLILKSNERDKLIGRIIQNIKLCQKYNVDIVVGSFATKPFEMRNPGDIESFIRLLGVKNPKKSFQLFLN